MDANVEQAMVTWIVILVLFYFIPWVIAGIRGHHNTKAIFILNLFLGWTFLGWVGALIWAFTSPPRTTTVYREADRQTPHL